MNVAGTLTQVERDQLLRDYDQLVQRLVQGVTQRPPIPKHEEQKFKAEREALLQQYHDRLLRLAISRCPYCSELLWRPFDAWGLDGLAWQPGESKSTSQPATCSHFGVLVGAVNLNGLPAKSGPYGAYPGPEVPYVIPRILQLPTMLVVISAIPMSDGYTAYPVAYFSEVPPPPGSLTQSWTKSEYHYTDASGRQCWTVKTDPWDFDLAPWVQCGKVKWIDPGDASLTIRQHPATAFPFANLPGRREQQVIKGNKLTTQPPPNNEEIDPFVE